MIAYWQFEAPPASFHASFEEISVQAEQTAIEEVPPEAV